MATNSGEVKKEVRTECVQEFWELVNTMNASKPLAPEVQQQLVKVIKEHEFEIWSQTKHSEDLYLAGVFNALKEGSPLQTKIAQGLASAASRRQPAPHDPAREQAFLKLHSEHGGKARDRIARLKELADRRQKSAQTSNNQEKAKKMSDIINLLGRIDLYLATPQAARPEFKTPEYLKEVLTKLDSIDRSMFMLHWAEQAENLKKHATSYREYYERITMAKDKKVELLKRLDHAIALFKTPPENQPKARMQDFLAAQSLVQRAYQAVVDQKEKYFVYRDEQKKLHAEDISKVAQVLRKQLEKANGQSPSTQTLKKLLEIADILTKKLFTPRNQYPLVWVDRMELEEQLRTYHAAVQAQKEKYKAQERNRANAAAAALAPTGGAKMVDLTRGSSGEARPTGRVSMEAIRQAARSANPVQTTGAVRNPVVSGNAAGANPLKRSTPDSGSAPRSQPQKKANMKEFLFTTLPNLQKVNPQFVHDIQRRVAFLREKFVRAPAAGSPTREWWESYHKMSAMASSPATKGASELAASTLLEATLDRVVSSDAHRFVEAELKTIPLPDSVETLVVHHRQGGSDITVSVEPVLAIPCLRIYVPGEYPTAEAQYKVYMLGGKGGDESASDEFDDMMVSSRCQLRVGQLLRTWLTLINAKTKPGRTAALTTSKVATVDLMATR